MANVPLSYGGPSGTPLAAGAMPAPGMVRLAEVANFGAVGLQFQGYATPALTTDRMYPLTQPGNMSRLLGIIFINANSTAGITTQTFSLLINSNNAIDTIPILAACPQNLENGFGNNSLPFFPIYRDLKGTDQIQVTIKSTAAVANLYTVLVYAP